MPSRTSASPSPPPEAPVSSTPGPRAAALQKVFGGALTSSIKANSYENFSSCFPTPAKYCPTALEGVWKQLNTRLEEECLRDFEKILEERRVVEGLNQWDSLVDEARRRKNRALEGDVEPQSLHTLSAAELHNAHLMPYLQQATQELEAKLEASQDENQRIMAQINAQRIEIDRLMGAMEGVVRDLETSVQSLNSGADTNPQALRSKVWEMEQEMASIR